MWSGGLQLMPEQHGSQSESTTFDGNSDPLADLTQRVRSLVHSVRASHANTGKDALPTMDIADVCKRATDEGLYPEQLLVIIKREWRAQSRSPAGVERELNTLLERLISASIASYYRFRA